MRGRSGAWLLADVAVPQAREENGANYSPRCCAAVATPCDRVPSKETAAKGSARASESLDSVAQIIKKSACEIKRRNERATWEM